VGVIWPAAEASTSKSVVIGALTDQGYGLYT
jgi:hypothetical protein